MAEVKDGAEEQRTLALYNGKEAVGIDLKKAKGYSTTDVSERVLARIEEVRKRLPANVKLDVVQDAGARVDASVGNVEEALLLGALLTVLVVFLFLNSGARRSSPAWRCRSRCWRRSWRWPRSASPST